MNEADLIHRCQTGDREAFRLLMERYGKLLHGTAYLMTREYGSAEDAVQEALINVWRGLPSFRPTGSFKAWVIRILVNEVGKQRRKKRVREAPLEDALAVTGNPGETEDAVLQSEERRLLRRGVESLSRDQKETVVLRYYADLTIPEVAKVMGCREGTVKSRLHRALNKLKEALKYDELSSGSRQEE